MLKWTSFLILFLSENDMGLLDVLLNDLCFFGLFIRSNIIPKRFSLNQIFKLLIIKLKMIALPLESSILLERHLYR